MVVSKQPITFDLSKTKTMKGFDILKEYSAAPVSHPVSLEGRIKYHVDMFDFSNNIFSCDCYNALTGDNYESREVSEVELLKHLEATENGQILFNRTEDQQILITLDRWLEFTNRTEIEQVLATIINKRECRDLNLSKDLL